MRYLLDTNHASAVFSYRLDLASHPRARATDTFGLSIPTIAELWYMVFHSARLQKNTERLTAILSEFEIWPFDERAAVEFGRIKSEVRRAGRLIPDFDIQISSVARVNDLIVLTADAHFGAVSQLKHESWL
jgi:tRNA(fMet)-specific endonuclease VapC